MPFLQNLQLYGNRQIFSHKYYSCYIIQSNVSYKNAHIMAVTILTRTVYKHLFQKMIHVHKTNLHIFKITKGYIALDSKTKEYCLLYRDIKTNGVFDLTDT
ncbi:hypothetical protein KUTeg_009589, partial [Tegillarca granosa]